MKKHILRRVVLLALILGGSVVLISAVTPLQNLSKQLETLFAVFRAATQLNVDGVSTEKLMEGAINGMVAQLDPYARYTSKEQHNELIYEATGGYAGVGMSIRSAGKYAQAAGFYPNSPALKVGFKVGDTIVAVDGKSVEGMALDSVTKLLRGDAGTQLAVTVKRHNVVKPLEFRFTREVIQTPSVELSMLLDSSIAYVRYTSFRLHGAKEIEAAVKGLLPDGEKPKGIILDLRDNPGGLINEAQNVLSLFLPHDTKILDIRGRNEGQNEERKTTRQKPPFESVPLAVLVGRSSASASEVVSGAIQDLDRGVIIGERTFGKGLVQSSIPLPNEGYVRITTAKYYTPSGRCIQALDYAHRDKSGAVGRIPDSLITPFHTKSGRMVLNGGGVFPDIVAKPDSMTFFVANVVYSAPFFDYTMRYVLNNRPPADINNLRVNRNDLDSLRQALIAAQLYKKSPFDGVAQYAKFVEEDPSYGPIVKPHFDAIRADIVRGFDTLFWSNERQIREILEMNIASLYLGSLGVNPLYLRNDEAVAAALRTLHDRVTYEDILRRQSPPDPRVKQIEKKQ